MKSWKYIMLCSVLAFSLALTGSAAAQEEEIEEGSDPFGGLFDPEDMEMEMVLEWESIDTAELRINMEMDLGELGPMFRGMLDSDHDGEVEEDEISEMDNPFDDIESDEGPIGLQILIDNKTAQMDPEAGWTGLLGDVNSTEPLGMYAVITFTWSIDEDLDRHTISFGSTESEEETDDNVTVIEDDDDDMPFDMTFEIKLPDGWKIDPDTVVPESMKQYVKDDNTIELTSGDMENFGEVEGEIVSFEITKGNSEDSPIPLWLPVAALLIVSLSVGLIGRKRH